MATKMKFCVGAMLLLLLLVSCKRERDINIKSVTLVEGNTYACLAEGSDVKNASAIYWYFKKEFLTEGAQVKVTLPVEDEMFISLKAFFDDGTVVERNSLSVKKPNQRLEVRNSNPSCNELLLEIPTLYLPGRYVIRWSQDDIGHEFNNPTASDLVHTYTEAGKHKVSVDFFPQGEDTSISWSQVCTTGAIVQSSFTFFRNGSLIQFINYTNNPSQSYSWDFGDGSSSTEKNPSHTYTAQGLYTVKLISNPSSCATGDTAIADLEIVSSQPFGNDQLTINPTISDGFPIYPSSPNHLFFLKKADGIELQVIQTFQDLGPRPFSEQPTLNH